MDKAKACRTIHVMSAIAAHYIEATITQIKHDNLNRRKKRGRQTFFAMKKSYMKKKVAMKKKLQHDEILLTAIQQEGPEFYSSLDLSL